jgi:hypothetical protein
MLGRSGAEIVRRMDIGNTLRCYTVEPLRDPVPRSTSDDSLSQGEPQHEIDQTQLLDGPSTTGGPALIRRAGG